MALNSSGQISLGGSTLGESVALELGLSATNTISLNDNAVRNLASISTGAISMNDLRGKFYIVFNAFDLNSQEPFDVFYFYN